MNKRISRIKKLCVTAVAAALAIASVVTVVDLNSGSASADSAYIDLGPIPEAVLSTLTDDYGVDISNVLASLPSSLSALLAPVTDVARDELGIDLGTAPESISLATVTTSEFGEDTSSDPMNPNIVPGINDSVLTWVVTFDNVTIPVVQRPQDDGSDAGPSMTTATVVVFLNPLTSKFEYAIAL